MEKTHKHNCHRLFDHFEICMFLVSEFLSQQAGGEDGTVDVFLLDAWLTCAILCSFLAGPCSSSAEPFPNLGRFGI